MLKQVKLLDSVLRGQATQMESLRRGTIEIPVGGLAGLLIVLGMLYGMCMGCFGLIQTWGLTHSAERPEFLNGVYQRVWTDGVFQVLASTVKVPMLFVLTLVVTFPSLYVFNALVGSRLMIVSVLRLLVAAMAVMLTVLASFGTIIAFFSFTTNSYPFMLLLNVVVFAMCGFLGLGFLLQTLHRLTVATEGPPPLPAADDEAASAESPLGPGALEAQGGAMGRKVKTVFRIWILVFGLVGAQMGWVLRPFVGNPAVKFTFFRPITGSFFEGVINALEKLLR